MPESSIKEITSAYRGLIKRETEKLFELLDADFAKLINLSNKYKKSISQEETKWKQAKDEVVKLEKRRDDLKKREEEVDGKIKKANEQEEELVGLHRILNNKKKALDTREKELREEGLKLHEKIVPPKMV